MRTARWLLLAAILIIAATTGYVYLTQKKAAADSAPKPAMPLAAGVDGTAKEWHFSNSNGGCPALQVRAKNFKQIREPSMGELDDVDLRLFHNCGKTFDHVKAARAQFDTASGEMYSEGDVEIERGLPFNMETGQPEEPSGRLVKMVSSGVKFETKGGRVTTDKPAKFTFDQGDGESVGAEYDPNTRELRMKNNVVLNLKPKDPDGAPAKIETNYLTYFERDQKVLLTPYAKLTRDTFQLNTANAVATLDHGKLKLVEAGNAWGIQDDEDRKVQYAADQLTATLDEKGVISKIVAERNAKLISTSANAYLEVQSDRIDLDFVRDKKASVLTKALATGHSVVNSRPITKPGALPAESRVLRSEVVEMRMRAGGKEIENVETAGPGAIEFIPNRTGQPHRVMTGDRIWIAYGAANQIDKFRSVNVTTRTDNPPKNGKPVPPTITSSQEMRVEFDPKTHQIAQLEQKTNFKYESGDRKAQAEKGVLDQSKDLMTLTGSARVSDSTGSATADQIVMNQKSGDFVAEGHVTSMRLPDKKGKSSAMLSNDEPMQAKANKMTSTDSNLVIHYEGNAVAWQGANRVQADTLDIDRDEEIMKANGHVISQFVDKSQSGDSGKAGEKKQGAEKKKATQAAPVFTVVRAPEMTYTEEKRTAVYKGGVVLNRPNLSVKSQELTAFLKDKDADSSLDKAFAEGAVTIVQTAPGRVRTGTGEHGEYYADDERIILEKGHPKFVDSLKGTTEGEKLTYLPDEDRVLVNGSASPGGDQRKTESTIRRKRK